MNYRNDKELMSTFIMETAEHLDEIETGILKLENSDRSVDEELVHAMFRAAHSIKAGASLLKFVNIETLSHSLENVLQQVRLGEVEMNSDRVTSLLMVIDMIRELGANPLVKDVGCSPTIIAKLRETIEQ